MQLSAERIKRKYGKLIVEDQARSFEQCTDTIIRQVDDIRRMVDEFSRFARMPKPRDRRRGRRAIPCGQVGVSDAQSVIPMSNIDDRDQGRTAACAGSIGV
ncbi:MAG: hypothetical protein MZV49_07595 [Rhodopseudomonas palustris]|nr:hypothetical protein [Rhodopseudomonas palustris]